MNAHQRRKARRQDARDYPGLRPYQIAAIKRLKRGLLRAAEPIVSHTRRTLMPYIQQFGRALRPIPTGPTIAELQRAGHLPTTNQERT